ncbi:hypothetical protein [Cystobacter ferrugineus]|uniref:Lipoprotein n=1 Tax=Cystobacter ferrugineus TaxID=83449 RepID=A0A1L9BGB1_9BACT|nr:hypothetical protein [Cystobacter ferrugineus]OJH41265.1 hypothetical protein BON30_10340 [Cystobacter ferrugineus]
MKNLLKTGLSTCALAMLMTGCGTTAAQDEASMELATGQQELTAQCDPAETEEVIEHSCIHAESGPFQAVTAAALGTVPFVDVNLPHTAYNVTLPGSYGQYGGSVIFTAEESTEYAFLLSRYQGLRIFDGTTEVGLECRSYISASACGALKSIAIAPLEAGKDYRLEFRAFRSSDAQFTLLVEEAAHAHEHE